MNYLSNLDLDIRSRICDFAHASDGSLNDLLFNYEQSRAAYQKSYLRFEFYDRPSHLLVKAYKKVLRDFGYERRSLP